LINQTFLCSAGAFEDEDVTHVEGEVNPIRDLEIINEELLLKDEEYLTGHLDKLERTVIRGGDKKLKPEYVSSGGRGRFVTMLLSRLCSVLP
jgi:ribosome-binding ATPase YchF (GTP1/OBG family)